MKTVLTMAQVRKMFSGDTYLVQDPQVSRTVLQWLLMLGHGETSRANASLKSVSLRMGDPLWQVRWHVFDFVGSNCLVSRVTRSKVRIPSWDPLYSMERWGDCAPWAGAIWGSEVSWCLSSVGFRANGEMNFPAWKWHSSLGSWSPRVCFCLSATLNTTKLRKVFLSFQRYLSLCVSLH